MSFANYNGCQPWTSVLGWDHSQVNSKKIIIIEYKLIIHKQIWVKILSYWVSKYIKTQYDQSITKKWSLAPNRPEKWGCRIRDLFSKIRDLFNKFETYAVIRDYETKKTAGAAEPPEPPSLAPMLIVYID